MAIRLSVPDAEYHGSPGVTFHRLKEFINRGPAYFAGRYINNIIPSPEDKDWGKLGRAYHICGLEGEDRFHKEVVCMPATYHGPASAKKDAPMVEKPWNMNAGFCQEWVAAQHGKIVLNVDDYNAALAIGRHMRADQHASRLLSCGWPELTIEQTEPRFPVPVKGRVDWLATTSQSMSDAWAIVDPKGTSELDRFEGEAFRYGYHRQLAFYRKLVRDEIGLQLPCFIPAVEKDGLHRVRVFQIADDLLDIGEAQNNRDLDKLAEHYAGKPWTLDHNSLIRVISTPKWMQETTTTTNDNGPAPWEV